MDEPPGSSGDDGEPVEYSIDAGEKVSEAVIMAVAATTGTDPTTRDASELQELDDLYRVVDPDALNALFRRPEEGEEPEELRLVFHYAGCQVTVDGGDRILVRPS